MAAVQHRMKTERPGSGLKLTLDPPNNLWHGGDAVTSLSNRKLGPVLKKIAILGHFTWHFYDTEPKTWTAFYNKTR